MPPGPGGLPGGAVPDGAGLREPRVLAFTAAHGSGTAVLTADLTLHAPTSTRAGGYPAVLTITVI
ncbi:hypothetical protein ABZ816_10680 [Actinosynnema sp. NPDC047251]|uniref:Uncharacterized protein n=1 Tax=Saccharothrix espanaensis (strain ATCC 51144 / DSM 44229 / JCM 9112 / NBRC 15066 / NRRL 15764) TaxID=1179773 RepID=K0KBS0_SACES|nr:hypothetical protein [Saccharothrix espanaensis]CCH34279.1 hypothetical protein BN6_70440 [Saccharothrix espanaensis DSM 44229]